MKSILFFYLSSFLFSSCSDTSLPNREKNLKIRLLPCTYLDSFKNKSPALLRLYSIETSSDTANSDLVLQVDSFICSLIKDSITPNNYSRLIICFLKESELTKQFKNNEITDSHNPLSAEHYEFVKYCWYNGVFGLKFINNMKSQDLELECSNVSD